MGRSHEHLTGGGIPPLEYGELLKRGRWSGPILSPRDFPIHPSVFESDLTYNPEFAQRVMMGLRGSIEADIAAMKRVLGAPPPVRMDDEGIVETNRRRADFHEWRRFGLELTGGSIGIAAVGSANALNTWIDRTRPSVDKLFDSPIPKKKIDQYQLDQEKHDPGDVLIWYAHNIGEADMAQLLVFRNFAILVNNLGLEMVGQPK